MTTQHVVLLAHGSPDPRHGRDIEALAARVRDVLPEPLHVAYLDHQGPSPHELADRLPPVCEVVVVPLLLAAGHHQRVDVPDAAAVLAGGRPLSVTRVLGPDPLIEDAERELRERGGSDAHVPRFLAAGILRDRDAAEATARGESVVDDALATTTALTELVVQRIREGFRELRR